MSDHCQGPEHNTGSAGNSLAHTESELVKHISNLLYQLYENEHNCGSDVVLSSRSPSTFKRS